MDRNEQFVTDRIRESETRTAGIIADTKEDFCRVVAGYQEVIIKQVHTLGNTMVAECSALSGRIGQHKESLDKAIEVIKTELGSFQLSTEHRIATLEARHNDLMKSQKALLAVMPPEKNGSVTMMVLRDVALLIAMIGTLYAILRDSFVTPRDLLVKNPRPPTVTNDKP
jgi:hypothetical protein